MDWDSSFEESYKNIMQENNNLLLKVAGRPFKCRCGCNVFNHPEGYPEIFACNSCDKWYEVE